MNILLTGSGGFIGQEILRQLRKNARPNDRFFLLTQQIEKDFISINTQGYAYSPEIFNHADIQKIDAVIHLGAFTPKSGKSANLRQLCNQNIKTTSLLLESLPNVPKQFIFISTLDVYGFQNQGPIDETLLPNPQTLYGFSKYYCENMLRFWAKENSINLKILRLGHIYGIGEDTYQKIIPSAIRQLLANQKIHLYTSGEEKRSFLNVKDCAALILSALDRQIDFEIVNIASSHVVSIKETLDILMNIAEKKDSIKYCEPLQIGQDIIIDNQKMCSYYGVETLPLYTGLQEEYAYFKSQQS